MATTAIATPLAALGRLSYSLYVWQQMFAIVGPANHRFLLIACSLVTAALSYILIEKPCIQMGRRLTRVSESPCF